MYILGDIKKQTNKKPQRNKTKPRKNKFYFSTKKSPFEYFESEEFPLPITKAKDLGEYGLHPRRGRIISGLSLENEAINPLRLSWIKCHASF